MISRIKDFIDYQSISVRYFERTIGCSIGLINKAIQNNTDISAKWITSIAENFPQLSIAWLVSGKGKMLKNEDEVLQDEKSNDVALMLEYLKEKDAKIEELSEEIRKLSVENCELRSRIDRPGPSIYSTSQTEPIVAEATTPYGNKKSDKKL